MTLTTECSNIPSILLVQRAPVKIPASRHEVTTTLYRIRFLRGGIENLSFSTSLGKVRLKLEVVKRCDEYKQRTAKLSDGIRNLSKGSVLIIKTEEFRRFEYFSESLCEGIGGGVRGSADENMGVRLDTKNLMDYFYYSSKIRKT